MKINQCQFCDSPDIRRDRYVGVSFVIMTILTFGLTLIGIPWLPVKVMCMACGVEYLAS